MKKQTVYLPVKIGNDINTGLIVKYIHSGHKYPIEKQEGYFFTPEQLNEYTANVIKQALKTAAEKVDLIETDGDPDPKSILNTFEETYKQFQV